MTLKEKLKLYREGKNLTLKELKNLTKIDISVLSKFENGSRFPNTAQLSELKSALELNQREYLELEQLTKYRTESSLPQGLKFIFNPNIQIIYTDSVFLSVNQFGLTLNVAQPQGEIGDQIIVSRIGMSRKHAKILARKIIDLLEKSEKELKETSGGVAEGSAGDFIRH